MRALLIALVLAAAASVLAQAQSPLTAIERAQRQQFEANRNLLGGALGDRQQQQLDLERSTFDESRRRREDYRFQGNTAQRALETQLREEDLRIRDIDRRNREYEEKQRTEEQRLIEEMRRRQGLQ